MNTLQLAQKIEHHLHDLKKRKQYPMLILMNQNTYNRFLGVQEIDAHIEQSRFGARFYFCSVPVLDRIDLTPEQYLILTSFDLRKSGVRPY